MSGYAFAEVENRVNELKKQGITPIDFGVGDPQDPTPEVIRESCKKALDKRASAGYPSYIGSEEFRNEIAQRFLDYQAKNELHLEEGKSVVSSKKDSILSLFGNEYSRLLSHRKTVEDINPEILRDAFFHKRELRDNYVDNYSKYSDNIKNFVENILDNMVQRFKYSRQIALDTVIFALRKDIVDFYRINDHRQTVCGYLEQADFFFEMVH